MSNPISIEESHWLDAFQQKIKKRNFEQFGILLFNFHDSTAEQKTLLHKILFQDHTSVQFWSDYIQYACNNFDKKNHLQRLANKALEFLDEQILRDDSLFLRIHLHSARLKSTNEETLRYFQNTLWKRQIGKSHASLYLAWSEFENLVNGIENAVGILQKGIAANAQPQQLLLEKLASLTGNNTKSPHEDQLKKSSKSKMRILFDNGEVQFNAKISDVNQNEHTGNIDEKEEDDTKTQKIPMLNSGKILEKTREHGVVLRKLKTPSSSSLGKCQRVFREGESNTKTQESQNFGSKNEPQDDELSIVQAKSSIISENNNSVQQKKKPDLSKYMDDTLKNFNPSLRLSKSTSIPSKQGLSDSVVAMGVSESPAAHLIRQPFSVMETNVEIPIVFAPQNVEMKNMAIVKSNCLGVSNNSSLQIPLDVNHSSAGTAQDPNKEILDDVEGETVKMPTQEIKNAFAAISKDSIKSAAKRKRVSFTPQDEACEVIQRKQKEMRKESYQSILFDMNTCSTSQIATDNGIFSDPQKYITICGKRFVQTSLMGKGGSSAVRRVISCDDGAIYALKVVEIKDNEDSDSVFESYANEINLLKKLKGTSPYIIDLVDSEISREDLTVTMLLEAGDIDLAKLLTQKLKISGAIGNCGLDPIFSRMVWKEMLLAVHHIHEHRIVHGDLKPANFVFVKGHLKLIDFGIAKSFSSDTTNIYRDSQIGTVNYMAPEAIAPTPESICHNRETNNYSMKLGRASDIWSLGCILYQMIYGRPPFAAFTTVQKLAVIPNPNVEIPYPPFDDLDALDSIKSCLIRNPKYRSPIVGQQGLLAMKYLSIPYHENSVVKANNNGERVEKNPIVFDESSTLRKFAPMMIESIKLSLFAKLGDHIDKAALDCAFIGIDVGEMVQAAMSGSALPKLLPSRKSAPTTITTTREIVGPTNISPAALLRSDSSDKENPPSSKIIQHTSVKKSIEPKDGTSREHNSTKSRSPIKILPLSLKEQIQNESNKLRNIQSVEGIAHISKWQRPVMEPEPNDLRAALEKRIDQMRKFLSDDQENQTATESIDLNFSYNFV